MDCSGQVWAAFVGSGELPIVLKRSWAVLKHFQWFWQLWDVSGKFRIVLECSYKPREFSMVWEVSSLKAGAL